jgi:hypothetical protein
LNPKKAFAALADAVEREPYGWVPASAIETADLRPFDEGQESPEQLRARQLLLRLKLPGNDLSWEEWDKVLASPMDLKLPQLRNAARAVGAPVSGTKAQLICRIEGQLSMAAPCAAPAKLLRARAAECYLSLDAAARADGGLRWLADGVATLKQKRRLAREPATFGATNLAGLRAALVAAGIATRAQFEATRAAAQAWIDKAPQHLFGDLEAVWASANAGAKRRDLLSLPHAALKELLADDRTRVASENTVVHTIERWLAKNKVASGSAQAKELFELVRVARLTPHYARTVFCESALAKAHLRASELALASMAPLVGDKPTHALGKCQQWRLPARPRSALAGALVLEWCPRLAELEDMASSLPAEGKSGRSAAALYGPKGVVWQGWPLYLKLQCNRSASGCVALGFYLAVKPPCSAGGALIQWSFEAVAADSGSGIRFAPSSFLYTAADKTWGASDFFSLRKAGRDGDAAPPKDWPGVEAALRAKRLVHGGSSGAGAAHVKLRCMVWRLE